MIKTLVDVEVIPYRNFKEKLKITKNLYGAIKVEDLQSAIMIIRLRKERN